jgi:hypothetical protein
MKHGKTLEQIERDERDVEDMRKDDAPIVVEARRAKKGREVRDWAHTANIIDPGASQAQ